MSLVAGSLFHGERTKKISFVLQRLVPRTGKVRSRNAVSENAHGYGNQFSTHFVQAYNSFVVPSFSSDRGFVTKERAQFESMR